LRKYRLLLIDVALAAILFGSAGRVDLPWFWAYLCAHAGALLVGLRFVDPGLAEERLKPQAGGEDRLFRLYLLPFYLGNLIVAGLDVGRFHWPGPMPITLQAIGLAVFAAGLCMTMWSMAVNRFFSPIVRIQSERGHHLITEGPYRLIRHPGYSGLSAVTLASGFALGSWWSVVPSVGALAVIVRRTILEDGFLKRELPGYADYAARVRYRFLPGVW
jgi:protein-S-isoprenylcysteine O-methyltransferase Ste14